ncbi:MAG: helix-turn-helix domain-containing protein [Deltaproteobacteria bacterium]
MQELLARLKTLDPNASLALRVIACFDELVRGGVNTQALLGAAASLSGCVAGYARASPQSAMRVAPSGEVLSEGDATPHPNALTSDGLCVWLERDCTAQANDTMILERLALALEIRHGRKPEDPLLRLGALLDAEVDPQQRRAAAAKLGLSARGRYRVLSLPLFATWNHHPEMLEDVVPTRFGPMHVGVVPAEITRVDARPCGVGAAMPADALHRSFSTALVSLRLCAIPDIPIVVADDYGGLVELLAQCSIERPLLDVEELEDVMQYPWAVATLDALLRSASVREASRLAEVHHSTMQTRLETIRDALPFDPMDGIGRTRIGLAFLAWRLRHSSVLDLPPPSERR